MAVIHIALTPAVALQRLRASNHTSLLLQSAQVLAACHATEVDAVRPLEMLELVQNDRNVLASPTVGYRLGRVHQKILSKAVQVAGELAALHKNFLDLLTPDALHKFDARSGCVDCGIDLRGS